MRTLRLFLLCILAAQLMYATQSPAEQFVAPRVRIVNRIDESDRITLKGNTHPAARAANDRGRVSPTLAMTDLILVLSRDSVQQAAFDKFVGNLYNPDSPDFHQWLTPQQVGADFGPSETDVATIANWLTGHGFTVSEVSNDRLSIRFNGTAALVESAFHTEIHNLSVHGVAHIANMSDPEIPAALASVVVGVKALHNFFPRPEHHLGSAVERDSATGMWKRLSAPITARPDQRGAGAHPAASAVPGMLARPEASAHPEFGISVGGTYPYLDEDVGPYDFATIYNILPLWNASSPIDGAGQTIAIAGTSDIEVGQATTETGASGANDIATFRTFFGLPTGNAANTPMRISGNSQPLTVCSSALEIYCSVDDLIENTLDVEWSGSVARNAQIVLVASYPASTTDDNLYDSESYIVNNLTARIMNVSYGECEQANGTAGNVQYYDLWQTAAAEGISVFVAAGDSGSASCDQGGDAAGLPYPAEFGLNVSGLASTPYNTAVGGTDFNWCPLDTAFNTICTASPYWNASNSSGTNFNAKGYVPETPWNESCANPLTTTFLADFANVEYGLTSGVSDTEDACNFLVAYSSGVGGLGQIDYGILSLVDTVGGSGGASGCVVNGTTSTSTTLGACTTGATSTGATTNPDTNAAQASLTVVNNGWPKPSWQTNAAIPGLPSDGVRDLPDVSFFASDGLVSSSAYLICVSDVAPCSYSTKSEPTAQEVGGTSVATPAMAGVMALINQKAGAAQGLATPGLYALAAKQTYSNCSAESATTGNGCMFNDIDSGTNAMPCDYDAYVTTPSPNCTILHSGDYVGILPGYSGVKGYDQATGLGSLNVTNVVNGWVTVAAGSAAATLTVTPTPTTLPISEDLVVVVAAAGPKGNVTSAGKAVLPTGSVKLTAGTYTSSSEALGSDGTATFIVPSDSLSIGGNTIQASYTGDVLYGAATGSAQVTGTTAALLTPVVAVTPAATGVNTGASLTVVAAITGTGATPSGTVTLTGGGYSSGQQTLSAGGYTFKIPANTLANGADTLTLAYFGDANYIAADGTAVVTVGESTFSLAATAPAAIAPGATATSTITVTAVAGYTGTVTLTCQEEADSSPTTGDGATCSIPTGVVAMGGTVVATVNTSAPVSAALRYPKVHGNGRGWEGAGGGAVLALVLFFGIPARRRSWRAMLGMVMLMAALGTMAACGGGSSNGGGGGGGTSDPGTVAGTYTFTVVATGSPSVTPTVQTTFTVTVN